MSTGQALGESSRSGEVGDEQRDREPIGHDPDRRVGARTHDSERGHGEADAERQKTHSLVRPAGIAQPLIGVVPMRSPPVLLPEDAPQEGPPGIRHVQ